MYYQNAGYGYSPAFEAHVLSPFQNVDQMHPHTNGSPTNISTNYAQQNIVFDSSRVPAGHLLPAYNPANNFYVVPAQLNSISPEHEVAELHVPPSYATEATALRDKPQCNGNKGNTSMMISLGEYPDVNDKDFLNELNGVETLPVLTTENNRLICLDKSIDNPIDIDLQNSLQGISLEDNK